MPEGKARSSQNARKHGFAASPFAVIRVEDAESVARRRADIIAVYQPVNSQELFAIGCMALAQQSLLRAAQLEAGLFTVGLNNAIEDETLFMSAGLVKDLPISHAQSRAFFMTQGFCGLCQAKGNDPWRIFPSLPGPGRAQLPSRARRIRAPQSTAQRVTERTRRDYANGASTRRIQKS